MFVESKTIQLLAPEVILILAATAMYIVGAFRRTAVNWVFALVGYLLAAGALAAFGSPWTAESTLSGPLVVDPMSLGLRWIALLAGITFTLAVARLVNKELEAEFLGTLMLVIVGVMLTASANELVLLFLGLEMISVPTYVLLFLGRRDRASAEATMKYFFLSLLSSALLLYGFCFLYGISGTTVIAGTSQFPGIREAFSAPPGLQPLMDLAPLGLVFVLAGLGFKLAAAPFQFYAPDVYQGTTNANAGLLAVAPKLAGVAGLIRVVVVAMPGAAEYVWQLALVLAILTMTIGNVCALWQKDLRRLLAYSSIAHGGYLLIGLAVGAASTATGTSSGGIGGMLFYVLVYALATMGTFCTLAYLGSAQREVSGVSELSGLAKHQPLAAAALAVFMFSLAGIPPLAGFWGKLTLFGGAMQISAASSGSTLSGWFLLLAIMGAVNAAIAAAYYLRIIAVMYFQPSGTAVPAAGGMGALAGGVLCALLVIVGGMFPAQVVGLSLRSEQLLRAGSPAKQPEASIRAATQVVASSPQE